VLLPHTTSGIVHQKNIRHQQKTSPRLIKWRQQGIRKDKLVELMYVIDPSSPFQDEITRNALDQSFSLTTMGSEMDQVTGIDAFHRLAPSFEWQDSNPIN
jgi:hypothetical protein